MAKRELQEINAGSMADIAFLLLIFFLVTTTMESNYGIVRKLPPPEQVDTPPPPVIKEKNVLQIVINGKDQMLIEEEPKEVKDVKKIAIEFITNNGKDPNSSDNPQKAVVMLKHARETTYKEYLTVYNELIAAYNDIRNRYAKQKYGKPFDKLTDDEQKVVKDAFPQKIAESTPKR